MNDQSPPKRVTRARAAAKTDTGVKIATAASKAKVTRTASTKRKTNTAEDDAAEPEVPKLTRGRAKKTADAHEEDSNDTRDELTEQPKPTRGRAKKTAEKVHTEQPSETVEPEMPKTTRGRAKKAAVTQTQPEVEMEDPAPTRSVRGRPKKAIDVASAPARSTRGRAAKLEAPGEEAEEAVIVIEEPRKPTRARVAIISQTTAPKKTVKFEEADKENIIPPAVNAKGKVKVTEVITGLKAKPVRKPATAAPRATRGRPKVEEQEHKSSPLSPKKATQVATAKEQTSDDELAVNEKTPMKSLMKSPIRALGSVLGTAKRLDFSNSVSVNRAVGQDLSASIMASPARRPPQSPFKESLKTSPQRANFAGSLMKSPFKLPLPPKTSESTSSTDLKASLLKSPARRPQSPTKVSEHGSPIRSRDPNPMITGVTPRPSTFKISRFATPRTLTKTAARPGQMLPPSAFKKVPIEGPEPREDTKSDELAAPSLSFSGRLSSIMLGKVDTLMVASESVAEETNAQSVIGIEQPGEPMPIDNAEQVEEVPINDQTTTPLCSPPRNSTGAFALREIDENPFMDSESEDELASASPKFSPNLFASSPTTPTPLTALKKTPKTQKSSCKERRLQIGFTPLARQLSDWMASSPDKSDQGGSDVEVTSPTLTPRASRPAEVENVAQPTPAKSTFFDDEMSVRDEMQSAPETADDLIDKQNFTPIEVIDEDLALAEEADEMSLLEVDEIEEREEIEQAMEILINTEDVAIEPMQTDVKQWIQTPVELNPIRLESIPVEDAINFEEQCLSTETLPFEYNVVEETDAQTQIHTADELALSEASQEYGDENHIPIDPAILALTITRAPVNPMVRTPKRVLSERVCHTVSKVPLKAAEDSPMRPSPMKRSASNSRISAPRPSSNLTRSNTVISYSPTKSARKTHHQPRQEQEDVIVEEAYATPSKPDTAAWSNMGTPGRTPCRDLNTALLKGAVVFVDVHTSEGADASSLFTELLTQMGARCVKSWNWNPSSDDGSKIGITHIVFKDGGKRTLDKAKKTGGVVICVGVGWVLE